MHNKEIITINREVNARLIPSGAMIQLQEGTEVILMQDLGGTYTVNVYGNLVSIDTHDADALGKEPHDVLADIDLENTPLEDLVWMQLKTCYDPEIPVNIVDLGLVYECNITPTKKKDLFNVDIKMTLTAPGCGMGSVLAENAKMKILKLPKIENVEVEIVFDPPWTQDKMSEAAKLELGML